MVRERRLLSWHSIRTTYSCDVFFIWRNASFSLARVLGWPSCGTGSSSSLACTEGMLTNSSRAVGMPLIREIKSLNLRTDVFIRDCLDHLGWAWFALVFVQKMTWSSSFILIRARTAPSCWCWSAPANDSRGVSRIFLGRALLECREGQDAPAVLQSRTLPFVEQ